MENTTSRPMETYDIYGTHTIEACPINNKKNRDLFLHIVSTFEQNATTKGIKVISIHLLSSLGIGVAGLNIAPEVPAMMMFRCVIFDAVCLFSKSLCEVRK